MERTIRVTGRGKLSVRPDTTRITITLSEVLMEYEVAVKESTEKKKSLTDELAHLGFEKSDLKTLSFNISPEYESYHDKKGNWQQRFTGYRYTHAMKLEFPVDNEKLGKVFYKLAHSPGAPEFRVQYTVKDPEPLKNQLLTKAVSDAKEKAEVLSTAAGVQLGEIQLIDYSWGEVELVSREYMPMMAKNMVIDAGAEESYDIDIEADDINIEDTVTVVWTIGS